MLYSMSEVKRARAARAKVQTESQIVSAILAAFKLQKVRAWKVNAGTILGEHKGKRWAVRGAPKGTPDILVHLRGPFWGLIEVKRPGKRLSDDQETWHKEARAEGILVDWCTSVAGAQAIRHGWLTKVFGR